MPRSIRLALTSALLAPILLGSRTAAAQSLVLSTRSSGRSEEYVCCVSSDFRNPFFSLAQTFVRPTGAGLMRDFTFRLGPNEGTMQYHAYLVAWDDARSRPSDGAPLWSSGLMTSPGTFTDVVFNLGTGVTLMPGQSYAALLTVITPDAGRTAQTAGGGNMQTMAYEGGAYTGGSMYRFYTYDMPAEMYCPEYDPDYPDDYDPTCPMHYEWNGLTSRAWDDYQKDASFMATFDAPTTVPEPATLPLLVAGASLLALGARRRMWRGA